MMSCILLSKNEVKVYCINQGNATSDVRLATYLMIFECQPCGIFECFLHHKEDEAISPTSFSYYTELVDRAEKLITVSNQVAS